MFGYDSSKAPLISNNLAKTYYVRQKLRPLSTCFSKIQTGSRSRIIDPKTLTENRFGRYDAGSDPFNQHLLIKSTNS